MSSRSRRTSGQTQYKLLLDVPSKNPALGFPDTAAALAEIISVSDPQFAIGIFGGWGSGKTTLMQAIEQRLDPDKVISVRFTAWRYEREEHLIIPLLDTIREALVAWSTDHPAEREPARKIAATIGRVTRSILAGLSMKVGVPGAIDVSWDANKTLEALKSKSEAVAEALVPRSFYHASFAALRAAFEGFTGDAGKRIVVFVDDLDRCLPENALQVMESMKLFFDLEGFVFVVGLDHEVVEQAIDAKYPRHTGNGSDWGADGQRQRITGAEYIKKIFQLPYRLAPVSLDQLGAFLKAACDEAELGNAQREELTTRVRPHLDFLVGNDAVNPREVKRYINVYLLLRKVNADLNLDAVLAWQTIDFREEWEPVRAAVLEYGTVFTTAVVAQLRDERSALMNLDPQLDRIPDDFLEYVAVGRPGRPIVEVPDLDRYVSSGATVGSTLNPRLLDAIRSVGEIRRELLDARQQKLLAADALAQMLKRVGQARGAVLSSGSSALTNRVLNGIDRFEQRGSDLHQLLAPSANAQAPAPGWDDYSGAVDELEQIIRETRDRLQRLYRTGNLSGPSVASEPMPAPVSA